MSLNVVVGKQGHSPSKRFCCNRYFATKLRQIFIQSCGKSLYKVVANIYTKLWQILIQSCGKSSHLYFLEILPDLKHLYLPVCIDHCLVSIECFFNEYAAAMDL